MNDVSLFSKLYIASQVRESDINKFFEHENHKFPISLSTNGTLRDSHKSDLLSFIEKYDTATERQVGANGVMIIDGPFLLHTRQPGKLVTFGDYAGEFCKYLLKLLEVNNRVDVVFDVYKDESLKTGTRSKRGGGIRRRVTGNSNIPSNWKGFLCDSENKKELFNFLADAAMLIDLPQNKQIIITKEDRCLYNPNCNSRDIDFCSQEEADTCIFLHASDAAKHGFDEIQIKTGDTDVLVLGISFFKKINVQKLWIAFGTKNKI